MKVQTKYNIDDLVVFTHKEQIWGGKIQAIKIYKKSDNTLDFLYEVFVAFLGSIWRHEDEIFLTIEELRESKLLKLDTIFKEFEDK